MEFQAALNQLFEREGIGWQLVDSKLIVRGDEAFEAIVKQSVAALLDAGMNTAKGEIHQALQDLSRRPEADLTGAIQHAMAALECVAREKTGDAKATLGQILAKYPNLIPKPLDSAVDKAWGFASEMGRHLREGRNPNRKDVEFVVGIAATAATYLTT
jgi:hypothetical protein